MILSLTHLIAKFVRIFGWARILTRVLILIDVHKLVNYPSTLVLLVCISSTCTGLILRYRHGLSCGQTVVIKLLAGLQFAVWVHILATVRFRTVCSILSHRIVVHLLDFGDASSITLLDLRVILFARSQEQLLIRIVNTHNIEVRATNLELSLRALASSGDDCPILRYIWVNNIHILLRLVVPAIVHIILVLLLLQMDDVFVLNNKLIFWLTKTTCNLPWVQVKLSLKVVVRDANWWVLCYLWDFSVEIFKFLKFAPIIHQIHACLEPTALGVTGVHILGHWS